MSSFSHLLPFHPVEQKQSYPPPDFERHTPRSLQKLVLQSPALAEAWNGEVPLKLFNIERC